jgi:hypothetical protein
MTLHATRPQTSLTASAAAANDDLPERQDEPRLAVTYTVCELPLELVVTL